MLYSKPVGGVAQLGERNNRTVEVRGSSPLTSTNKLTKARCTRVRRAFSVSISYGRIAPANRQYQ